MDIAHGRDFLGVGAEIPMGDRCRAHTIWTIRRYSRKMTAEAQKSFGLDIDITDNHFKSIGIDPYSTSLVVGNLITNNGWTRLMNLLTAQGGTQALSSTATRIGVGNSNTAEAYTDTDLGAAAGSANRWFQPVSGSGSLGTRTLSFSASFGTADGNFAWNEFGLDVGTPTVSAGNTVNALLFNHKAGIAQGTKASGQTWTATATITFT